MNYPLPQDSGNVPDERPADNAAAIPDSAAPQIEKEAALRRVGAIADLVLSAGMPLAGSVASWIEGIISGKPEHLPNLHTELDAVEAAVSQYQEAQKA